MRRLSDSNSNTIEWRGATLPLQPHPPPSTTSPAAASPLPLPNFPTSDYKSPPHHGPLSPIRVSASDCTETGVFTTPGNSPVVGSWDNYADRSSYELEDDQFRHVRSNTWKIPIVTTDISDLGLTSGSNCSDKSEDSDSVFLAVGDTMVPSEDCNNAAQELVDAETNLQTRMEIMDPDDID